MIIHTETASATEILAEFAETTRDRIDRFDFPERDELARNLVELLSPFECDNDELIRGFASRVFEDPDGLVESYHKCRTPESPLDVAEAFANEILEETRLGTARPDWLFPFQLARKLHRFGGKGTDYLEEVRRFCALTGRNPLDFIAAFIRRWKLVKIADTGSDLFDVLAAQSMDESDLIELPYDLPCPSVEYKQVFTFAWHWAAQMTSGEFALIQPRMSKRFGIPQKTISNIINWLCEEGALVCIDKNWVKGNKMKKVKGKGKLYRLA